MITVNQLPSSDPKIKAFHVLKDGKPVAVVWQCSDVSAPGCCWEFRRLEDGATLKLENDWCHVEELLQQLLNTDEQLYQVPPTFTPEPENCFIAVETGHGSTQYIQTNSKNEKFLTFRDKQMFNKNAALKFLHTDVVIDFLKDELRYQGDWAVRMSVICKDTNETLDFVEPPLPTKTFE